MNYLRVKNWKQFQQYKDRDPKWIKLHRDILDDYEMDALDELAQLHLIKIWLLAAKLDNKIPNDAAWIARKIGARSEVQLDQLVTAGFLAPYIPVQPCTEVYLEEETERETERETDKTTAAGKINELSDGEAKELASQLRPDLTARQVSNALVAFRAHIVSKKPNQKFQWITWINRESADKRKPTKHTGTLPQRDEDLTQWAAENGYDGARPGEDFTAFRRRLTEQAREKNERHMAAG